MNIEISKCEFYSTDENDIGRCYCHRSDGWGVELTACYSCTDNPNCYYKQLQALKQENELLKKKLSTIEIACDVDSYEFAQGDNLILTSKILEIIRGN